VFVLSQSAEETPARPGVEEGAFRSERATGMFEVRGGLIIPPEPRSQHKILGPRSWLTRVGGQALTQVLNVLISSAYAADVTISDGTPALFFDDTDVVGNEWQVHGNTSSWNIYDDMNNHIVFQMFPSANGENSLVVDGNGDIHLANDGVFIDRGLNRVGIGTITPQGNLHIFGPSNQDVFNGIGPDPTANGTALNFGYAGNSFGLGSGFFNVRPAPGAVAPNPSLRFATANQQRMIITNVGRVGIGTLTPSQALEVQGNIRANGSFLANGTTLNVPDYVFEPDYKLRSLADLQTYIAREKHLPDIPSAQEIKEQGVNLSELQMQLLKKVEELTLYTLEQEKVNQTQARRIAQQEQLIHELSTRLTALERRGGRH